MPLYISIWYTMSLSQSIIKKFNSSFFFVFLFNFFNAFTFFVYKATDRVKIKKSYKSLYKSIKYSIEVFSMINALFYCILDR